MTSLTHDVVILAWAGDARSTEAAARAREIAAFVGVDAATVALTPEALADGASIEHLAPKCVCLIVDAETLAKASDAMQGGVSSLGKLTGAADNIFVYGFQTEERHRSILQALSSGGLLGVQRLPGATAKFHVAHAPRESCGQFSGLDVRPVDCTRDFSFFEGQRKQGQLVFIRAADQPFFVRARYGRSDAFLLACGELADLDETVPPKAGLLPWFSRLVPLMIFLRGALQERAWHSEHSQACFIIDDPLLRRKYGFLEYAKLVEAMYQQKFSACIAFIPWNYRRSIKNITEQFSTGPCSLSVCVHGCDHTGAEFASTNIDLLRGKSQLALDRMRAHQEIYGLPFDDVMVFPQGLFSSEALQALESCGYLAAVNTGAWPANTQKALKLRDLLDVAVTAFAGVPLFLRHYPNDPAEFAFDLFLGKPAFLVEHHGYFRNGYEPLRSFVKQLNELDNGLEWLNPGAACSRASLRRVNPNGETEVRFYTSRFSLVNNTDKAQNYILRSPQMAPAGTAVVTVDGQLLMPKQMPKQMAEQKEDALTIRVTLQTGERAEVKIVPKDGAVVADPRWKPTGSHNARVLIRRVLSEVRDDHVATNRFLDGLLSGASRLRARGAAKA